MLRRDSSRSWARSAGVAQPASSAGSSGGTNDKDEERGPRATFNRLPSFVVEGSVRRTDYDGSTDDLLTAGLGKTGLAGTAPGFEGYSPALRASGIV